jgi:tRNA pseudouridine55 synthase
MSGPSPGISGETLGCLGHVVTLRRTWVGRLRYRRRGDAGRVEALAKTPEIDALLHPVALGLADLPELRATEEGAARLKNGNPGHVLPGDVDIRRARRSAWAS